MTLKEKFIIEMNLIARLNISEIEKKRRQSLLVDAYTMAITEGVAS